MYIFWKSRYVDNCDKHSKDFELDGKEMGDHNIKELFDFINEWIASQNLALIRDTYRELEWK